VSRLRRLAALMIAAALAEPALAEDPALAEVMRAFGSVQSARARFTETKELALLKAPLVLTGTLTYQRPDRLEKHVLTPYDERIAITGTDISVENKSRARTQMVSAAANPTLQTLIESLRATLAGDLPALERHFAVAFEGTASEWTIVLVPRDAGTLALISRIRLAGAGGRLARIEVDEAGGDRSQMTIHEAPR